MPTNNFQSSRFVRRTLLWLIWLACMPGWAQDKATMTWWQYHLPPGTILVDDKPSNGILDVKLLQIIANWPEVNHVFMRAPPARIYSELAASNYKACYNSAIITPERENQFYMSALQLLAPMGVVAKPAILHKLAKNAQGEVLPGALFDRTDIVGVINPGRSYSALLDALLSLRKPEARITMVTASHSGENLMRMIGAGRADYTLEYGAALEYLKTTEPSVKDAGLQFAPVAGMQLIRAGIACPRNAWGYAAINKIDAIITKLAPSPEFQQQSSPWFSAGERASMKPALDAFYKARARRGTAYQARH